jgi:hypothetical protein
MQLNLNAQYLQSINELIKYNAQYLQSINELIKYNKDSAIKHIKAFLDEIDKLPSEERMECLLNLIDNIREFPKDSKDEILKMFEAELKAIYEVNKSSRGKDYSDDKLLEEACELFHGNYKEPKLRIIK